MTTRKYYPEVDARGRIIPDVADGRGVGGRSGLGAAREREFARLGRILEATRDLEGLEALNNLRELVQIPMESGPAARGPSAFGPGVVDYLTLPDPGAGNQGARSDGIGSLDWRQFGSDPLKTSRDPLGLRAGLSAQGPGTNDVAGSDWVERVMEWIGLPLQGPDDAGPPPEPPARSMDAGVGMDAGSSDETFWDWLFDAGPEDDTAAIKQFIDTYGLGKGLNIHRWDNPRRSVPVHMRPADGSKPQSTSPRMVPSGWADEPTRPLPPTPAEQAAARRILARVVARFRGPPDLRGGAVRRKT